MKKLYLRDFGIQANSAGDAVPAFKTAIKSASQLNEPCEIVFDGAYTMPICPIHPI